MADYSSAASSLEFDSVESTDVNSTDPEVSSDADSKYADHELSSADTKARASSNRRTQSLTSSIYAYRHEHGRRYHSYADGQYIVPNDEDEQGRLDLQHHLFQLTLDGALYTAPLPEDIQTVMDCGTGTGIWAMDFADDHPSAQVLGVDLSPIQPTDVPPNCSFRIDDLEQDWIETESSYDFIHSRAMILAFKDWPRFFKQAYLCLKPGGFIELQDLCLPAIVDDREASAKSVIVTWLRLIIEAGNNVGIDPEAPNKWAQMLRDAGFVNINIKWFNWPIGPWAKHKKNKIIGRWCQADMENAVGASVGLMTRALGWSLDETLVFQAQVRKEMKDQNIHSYIPVAFCWARKPENPHRLNVNFLPDSNINIAGPGAGPEPEEDPARRKSFASARTVVESTEAASP